MARVNFEVLARLIKESKDCIDILEEQDKKTQDIATNLNEYFKDSSYSAYEEAFNEGSQEMKRMIGSLNELIRAVALYGKRMAEEK